jgi:hypothetical protein
VKCDAILGTNTCNCEHEDPSGLCFRHRNERPAALRLSHVLSTKKLDNGSWNTAIQAAENAIERLLMTPINLIPMKPTQAKQTRDDMHYGMQRAFAVVRALRK